MLPSLTPVVLMALVSGAGAMSVKLNADLIVTELPDWQGIRRTIIEEFDAYPSHDDGSIAPVILRLGWHSSSTFDPRGTPRGGSCGATMRFEPEASYEDNRGLELAREALGRVKLLHPLATWSDLWIFASYLAVEHLGGPEIEFRPGRPDAVVGGDNCPPEERIPVFDDPATAIRAKFGRMGMSDRDIVALCGGHSVGRTHPEHSEFPYYKWDLTVLTFDNSYYDFVLENWWIYDDGDPAHPFYFNRSWIMLLSDIALKEDPAFRIVVEEYALDEALWHREFADAYKRLTENGLENLLDPPVMHRGHLEAHAP